MLRRIWDFVTGKTRPRSRFVANEYDLGSSDTAGRAASSRPDSEQLMEYVQASLREGDRHTREGSYGAAQNIYEEVENFCREFRNAQTTVVPGQRIPLADRLMVANHFLSISLERLGDVHMRLGHVDEAVASFSGLIEAMEVVLRNSHGDTAEFGARLASARSKLAAAQLIADPPSPPQIAVRGYEQRYLQLMRSVAVTDPFVREVTLLLARRTADNYLERLTIDDVHRAVREVRELPDFSAAYLTATIEQMMTVEAAIRSFAVDLANVHRDHVDLEY
jgi:hypothetical protein